MDITEIRKLCDNRRIKWTTHVGERIHSRGISRKDVLSCISNGEIIEEYPNDYPFPSCLIYGANQKNEIIHVVLGCDGESVFIITAYYPNREKIIFETDLKTRKEP